MQTDDGLEIVDQLTSKMERLFRELKISQNTASIVISARAMLSCAIDLGDFAEWALSRKGKSIKIGICGSSDRDGTLFAIEFI